MNSFLYQALILHQSSQFGIVLVFAEFFSEDDDGYESINEILEGIENGDIKQKREPEKWFGNGELIDNLIGEMDNCFELSITF